MTTHKMDSSFLESVSYQRRTGSKDAELSVQFLDGDSRTYLDVPYDVFQKLLSAESQGKYFNQNIRGIYKEKF